MIEKNELGRMLLISVPDYRPIFDAFGDDSYEFGSILFFNEFAKFISEIIAKNPDSKIVNDSFVFMNKIGDSNSDKVINVLIVGILEILYTENVDSREYIHLRLSDVNRMRFMQFSKFYL